MEPRLLLPPQLPEEEEVDGEEDGARHTLTRHTQCRTLDHTLTEEEVVVELPLLPPQLLLVAEEEVVVVELPLLPPQLLLVAEEEEEEDGARHSTRRCRTARTGTL